MENKLLKNENEPVVIPDECGDTMWDEVLKQEVTACDLPVSSNIKKELLSIVNTVQVSDTTADE